jgi:hypothetical protein
LLAGKITASPSPSGHQGRGRGHRAPPGDGQRDHPALPETVGHAPGQRLGQGIAGDKGAEHHAKLHVGQGKIVLNRAGGNRDVVAIEERDRRHREQHGHNAPAHPRQPIAHRPCQSPHPFSLRCRACSAIDFDCGKAGALAF